MIRSTFAMPALIAAMSLVGLVTALTGAGWHDAIAWSGLLIPLLAIAWAFRTRRT